MVVGGCPLGEDRRREPLINRKQRNSVGAVCGPPLLFLEAGRMDRRTFMTCCGAVAAMGAGASPTDRRKPKVPAIHVTDLYRPAIDPDDHWDLACVYALAARGDIDLKAVVIDFLPKDKPVEPDIAAVAQMNHITGMAVPVVVGSPNPYRSVADVGNRDARASLAILDILRDSRQPVTIHVTGCARDVAMAGLIAPDVFADKCRAVYLNAGVGSPDPKEAARFEYNVSLDPAAYAAMFKLPCPVRWLPCFERMSQSGQVLEYGSYWRFRQKDILDDLPVSVQNYFASMFAHRLDHKWLSALLAPRDDATLQREREGMRNMWCTAALLDMAGYAVDSDGKLIPQAADTSGGVFGFDPVRVECSNAGVTTWSRDDKAPRHFLFHVRDLAAYETAMTRAMKTILAAL